MLGHLLRVGVNLAAIMVSLGGGAYLIRQAMEAPTYHIFRGEPVDLRTISGVVTDVSLQQLGFIQFGLLMLIATPIL